MFENKFNSTKTDPLVEAVKAAQQDGDMRRAAVAHVNEQFGVFNRNAIVRENLAAYDAAIEEAYKSLKEGKPLSPKQQKMAAVAGDPKKIDAADLKALRSGKKMEEKKDCYEEGAMDSDVVGGGAVTKDNKPVVSSTAPKADTSGPSASEKSALTSKISAMREAKLDEISTKLATRYTKKSFKDMKQAADFGDTMSIRNRAKGIETASKKLTGGAKVRTTEETLDEAVSRKHFQQVADLIKSHDSQEKRNELASHHASIFAKQNPRFDHGRFHKAAGSTAHEAPSEKKMEEQRDYSEYVAEAINKYGSMRDEHPVATVENLEIFNEDYVIECLEEAYKYSSEEVEKAKKAKEDLAEAAYSFKAAREGKDIGKKGKMFAKIAKKAGERYGSEERGKKVAGAVLAKIRAKHMKEDSSFNAALETGKSVNEIAMTTPPAIVQPAVPAAKQTQAVRPTASFGRQGAGARPLTPTTQSVSSSMKSPSFMSTSKLSSAASKVADGASKAATVASRAPGVAARIAGLAARVNPVAGAAMAGATASQALGKLATGTETGRAIGKSIGRAINPPVSTLPKADTTSAPAPKPSTVAIKKGETMTGIAKAQGTTVSDLAKANPDIKDVNKISAGKSLNLPKPAYTPKPVDQADTIRQSGGEPSVAPPKVAPTPPVRPADLGKTTAPSTSASVPTPPSRPAELDLPKIDKGPAPGPASAPNPKVDAPTPPSRPADLGSSESKPMQNPDQERTKAKTVSESVVTVGDNKYRIL